MANKDRQKRQTKHKPKLTKKEKKAKKLAKKEGFPDPLRSSR